MLVGAVVAWLRRSGSACVVLWGIGSEFRWGSVVVIIVADSELSVSCHVDVTSRS
jgi:hypothetical protein